MRSIKFLSAAALATAVAFTVTGCGKHDEPLTEAQMQRRLQEQQLQAQQQQLDMQRQQQRADLEYQRLQNQALQQSMLPPPAPQYSQPAQPVQQYAPATVPAPTVDSSGVSTGVAVLGAAAAGAAGYALAKSSNNKQQYVPSRPQPQAQYRSNYTYRPTPKPAVKPAYVAPKRTGTTTRFTSTKRR